MTKEELKKEAEEYISDNCKRWESDGLTVDDIANETYLAGAEPREKRIAELTTDNNTLLKENGILRKENAELKDKLNKIERKCKFNFVDLLHDVENESKQEEQLTKAKEIIKQLMRAIPYGSGKLATESYDKAEQFLKEIE